MRLNPVPCFSFSDPGRVTRKVFCSHYETCLDYAVTMSWESFSCEKCTAYGIEKKSAEEWANEAQKCMLLMQLIAFSGVGHKVSRLDSYVIKKRSSGLIYPHAC